MEDEQIIPRTCEGLDICLGIGAPSAQLLHDHLLLSDRRGPTGRLADTVISSVRARGDHTE